MRNQLLLISTIFIAINSFAQKKTPVVAVNTDSILLTMVKFRSIGPFRGGRSAAVAGDLKYKNTFYFGGTGGGVWKTIDAGSNWKNISSRPPWLAQART